MVHLCDIQFFSECLTLLLLFYPITCYVGNDLKKIYLTNCHCNCRLLLQHSMEWGTQLPYIKRAREYRWGVLVMNTNDNYAYKVWACMFHRRKYCTHHSINLFGRDWVDFANLDTCEFQLLMLHNPVQGSMQRDLSTTNGYTLMGIL